MGIAKVGGVGENTSGDIFIAFSTANSGAFGRTGLKKLQMLPNDDMTPLFEAVVQSTEEAILNALFAAETMTGINGKTVEKMPIGKIMEILNKHRRIVL
jgi:L-aminopeptidase/D-esterase-like protein